MSDKTPEATSASTWKKRLDNRKQKQRAMFEAAKKNYDIMYAVQNTSQISPWKSKVFVPVLASKAWDLIARMSDVVPLFNVTIKNELTVDDDGNYQLAEGVEARQKRIEAKLHDDYQNSCDEPMKLRVFDPLVDAVVAGTGYAIAPWVLEEKTAKARSFDENGTMDNSETIVKKTSTGHNGFEGVNFFNVFVGEASSFFRAPYVIVQGCKPKVDMELSGLYQNLDKCNTSAGEDDDTQIFNEARSRVVNETRFEKDDSVETITYYECYERTTEGVTLTTFAESDKPEGDEEWETIRPTSVPYWHNQYPILPFYMRKKSFSVFGESLFENNRTLQSATNDLFNHYLDNWNLSIDSMLMYEDGTLTNDFVIEPGGEITFTGEAPKQFKFPEPNPQQLSVVMNVLEKGIDAATFSPYATGTPSDGADKTKGTAYGVRSITEAATTKIGFFRDNFKQSMKILGRIWLSNLQQFADDSSEIRQTVDGKVVPALVEPSDYQGEVDLDIDDDSMTPLTKQDQRDIDTQLTQDMLSLQQAAINQYSIFKQVTDIPRLNFAEMIKSKAELASRRDVSRLLLDNTVEIPQEQQPDNTKEYLNFSYKDAPDDVKAQIETMYGLTPSAMHDSNMVHTAIQQGAEQGRIINEGENVDASGNPIVPAGAGNAQAGAAA